MEEGVEAVFFVEREEVAVLPRTTRLLSAVGMGTPCAVCAMTRQRVKRRTRKVMGKVIQP